MLRSVFPPICLLLSIAMAVVGFSMLAFGGPDVSVNLHEARAQGDELATTALEEDLETRQTKRIVMIVSLFVGSGLMTVVAFGAMQNAADNRN